METQTAVDTGAVNYAALVDGASIYLLPEEVEVEEIGDRIAGPDDEELTEQTAASIEAVGQQEPVKVHIVNGKPSLFMGRRRRLAVAMLNAAKKKGEEPTRLWAIVDNSKGDAFQRAVHENIHRKNYSAVELANIIRKVRETKGWKGGANTAKVAEYLMVSVATVTTHEKILKLPEEVIQQGVKERLSAGALIDLGDSVVPEKRNEVIASAKEKAKQEAAEVAKRKEERGKKNVESTSKKADGKAEAKQEPSPVKGKKSEKSEEAEEDNGRIKRKHVIEAAREQEALSKPKSRAKSEIAEFFLRIAESDQYGYQNSPVRQFASFFIEKYMAGTGSDKTALKKFDAMVLNEETSEFYAGVGTPNKAELEKMEEEIAKERESEKKAKAKAAGKK